MLLIKPGIVNPMIIIPRKIKRPIFDHNSFFAILTSNMKKVKNLTE
jgi:hypothetical protein